MGERVTGSPRLPKLPIAPEDDAEIDRETRWWERRSVLLMLVLIGLVPLLWPSLPPLTDLPGHMGRWHIGMAIGTSAPLARYYSFTWAPVGNLGMDLLVPALASVIPFELATKLSVMLIPALTMVGMLWTAREAHGRVPPTAFVALPLAYAWPFQFGFVNFTLAQGLAFCAFALWLRLRNDRRLVLRAVIFGPIACILWFTHSAGWALFCLMAAGSEFARLDGSWRTWRPQLIAAGVQGLPLLLPVLLMIASPHSDEPLTGDWFNWLAKGAWVASILRDRWQWFDIASLVPILFLFYGTARSPRFTFVPVLGWAALLCLVAFVLLPRQALGGAYVDMRMAPAMTMLGLLAIAPPKGSRRFAQTFAMLSVAFFLVRTTATTISFALRSGEQQRELAAIDRMPRGASVLSLVSRPCGGTWSELRRDHLPGMAIVRRDVFTNDQWVLGGQQLLRIRYQATEPYSSDPSQLVYPPKCHDVGSNYEEALRTFPRGGFSHVWTIGFPPKNLSPENLTLIWTNGTSALYRVRR